MDVTTSALQQNTLLRNTMQQEVGALVPYVNGKHVSSLRNEKRERKKRQKHSNPLTHQAHMPLTSVASESMPPLHTNTSNQNNYQTYNNHYSDINDPIYLLSPSPPSKPSGTRFYRNDLLPSLGTTAAPHQPAPASAPAPAAPAPAPASASASDSEFELHLIEVKKACMAPSPARRKKKLSLFQLICSARETDHAQHTVMMEAISIQIDMKNSPIATRDMLLDMFFYEEE